MLTERIDRALDALDASRKHIPGLRDVFRPHTPERVALDKLLAVLAEVDGVLCRSGEAKRRV